MNQQTIDIKNTWDHPIIFLALFVIQQTRSPQSCGCVCKNKVCASILKLIQWSEYSRSTLVPKPLVDGATKRSQTRYKLCRTRHHPQKLFACSLPTVQRHCSNYLEYFQYLWTLCLYLCQQWRGRDLWNHWEHHKLLIKITQQLLKCQIPSRKCRYVSLDNHSFVFVIYHIQGLAPVCLTHI